MSRQNVVAKPVADITLEEWEGFEAVRQSSLANMMSQTACDMAGLTDEAHKCLILERNYSAVKATYGETPGIARRLAILRWIFDGGPHP